MGRAQPIQAHGAIPQSYPRQGSRDITTSTQGESPPSPLPYPADYELTLTRAEAQCSGQPELPTEICLRTALV